jgi:hypothetical protein
MHHVVESDLEPKVACVPYMPGPVASKVDEILLWSYFLVEPPLMKP